MNTLMSKQSIPSMKLYVIGSKAAEEESIKET
jgi:hypothetical protein